MATWKLLTTTLAVLVLAVAARPSDPPGPGADHKALKPCGQEQAGYTLVPTDDARGGVLAVPYFPQPGDVLLYDFDSRLYTFGYRLVGSDAPIHAAIVVARPDGTPAILEVGPNSTPRAFTKTYIVDVFDRLEGYSGVIMIRRPCKPLSPEQSAELTRFAVAQEGKSFAVGRLALQGTPFRPRNGLRKALFAHTYLDRDRWICSENVVAAATVAGLLDPKTYPANAMYPRDLAYDERYNLTGIFEKPVLWSARVPVEEGQPRRDVTASPTLAGKP